MSDSDITRKTGVEIVRNYSVELAIVFPFIWFILLSIQAFREGNTSIYIAMGWLAIPLSLLAASDALIRYTKIDFDNKTILQRDGIGNSLFITPGSVLTMSEDSNGDCNFTLQQDGVKKDIQWKFWDYTKKKRQKILNALYLFNPQATRSVD